MSGNAAFEEIMTEVMSRAGRFGHREHLELTWLALRRHGETAAQDMIRAGIRATARYAGAPQKYHETISRAWVRLVAHHAGDPAADFGTFAGRYPALLDKRLLARHYSSAVLASAAARTGWVEPDLLPLPAAPPPDSPPVG